MNPIILTPSGYQSNGYYFESWPEEFRGVNHGNFSSVLFTASNGWRIQSMSLPAMSSEDHTLYLPGIQRAYDTQLVYIGNTALPHVMQAIQEFNQHHGIGRVAPKKRYPRVWRDKHSRRIYKQPKDVFKKWGTLCNH